MGKEETEHLEHRRTSDSIMGPGYTRKTSNGSDDALPSELISAGSQDLHRKLGGKEVQLFAIGGAIGTCKWPTPVLKEANTNRVALFVQMGAALPKGGPANLFLGFVIYGTVMYSVNQCFGTPSVTL